MGDHVKVMKGTYEGDTGLIVRVEENVVVLFSDLTMHEVRATNDIKQLHVTDHSSSGVMMLF